MSKYNIGLKTLLQGDLSELELYDDLVRKLRNIFGETDFPCNLKKMPLASKRQV